MSRQTNLNRILILVGLVICGFASSSYAKSVSPSEPRTCVSNVAELAQHPDKNSGCNKSALVRSLASVPQGELLGQGLASGKVLEFPSSLPRNSFYIIIDGDKVNGQICCSKGAWSIGGYGLIVVRDGVLSIGGFRFKKADQRTEYSTPRKTAVPAGGVG